MKVLHKKQESGPIRTIAPRELFDWLYVNKRSITRVSIRGKHLNGDLTGPVELVKFGNSISFNKSSYKDSLDFYWSSNPPRAAELHQTGLNFLLEIYVFGDDTVSVYLDKDTKVIVED